MLAVMPQQDAQTEQQSASLLLALPEQLLLAVLQCLAAAADHCSLFSAARAHSRLHQAAAAALSSVTVESIRQQKVLDGVLLYLSRHGQHVGSIDLSADPNYYTVFTLWELPPVPRLVSLRLRAFKLLLLPGQGWRGVLGPAAAVTALKQLQLSECTLLDGNEQLPAALAQLPPGLESLIISDTREDDSWAAFPTDVLQQRLHQLTHLELIHFWSADGARPALQPLQALSRLVDLRLAEFEVGEDESAVLTASMLSGATGLTCLELECVPLEPGALAGKTLLQHLSLFQCEVPGDAAWPAQLLSQLASLQLLTHLTCPRLPLATSPPAAYSALTASSKLQHLCLQHGSLPAGVWQQVFPAGRQLPYLTSLFAADAQQPLGGILAAPEGSRLVSCCPGLQSLDVHGLAYSAGGVSPLQALSGLHTLSVSLTGAGATPREVCQLTGLRDLFVFGDCADLLLHVTQLRQLTRLFYRGQHDGGFMNQLGVAQGPGDEPVWRQVLRLHLRHSNPAVAQQAAAALAMGAE